MSADGHELRHTEQDRPDTARIAIIGVVGAVILFIIIVAIQALFYGMERAEQDRKEARERSETVAQVRAEQRQRIGSYGWVDQKKGVVRIPIERAMELLVKRSEKISGQE